METLGLLLLYFKEEADMSDYVKFEKRIVNSKSSQKFKKYLRNPDFIGHACMYLVMIHIVYLFATKTEK